MGEYGRPAHRNEFSEGTSEQTQQQLQTEEEDYQIAINSDTLKQLKEIAFKK